jgi:natural product precursor
LIGGYGGRVRMIPSRCRGLPETNRARRYSFVHRGQIMKKKLTLSKETLRKLDKQELSLVVGGAANSGQFNPAKCPSSGHPNCN